MSIEEFHTLRSDEGSARFISQQTGLDYDRVLRIYRLRQPWPFLDGDEWDFGRQAEEAGVDIHSAMAALAPLIEMTVNEKQAKLEALEQMIARGEQLSQEQASELEAEMSDPVLFEHLEKIANLTNEPTEVIEQVCQGMLATLKRMNELTQELIDRRLRGEENLNDMNP